MNEQHLSQCDTQVAPSSSPLTCKKCMEPLIGGEQFCLSCGWKVGPEQDDSSAASVGLRRRNRRILKPVIISAVALFLVIAGVVAFISAQNAAVTRYKGQVRDYMRLLITSQLNLEDVGLQISSNWFTAIFDNGYYIKKFDDIDDAVSQALQTKSSELREAKTQSASLENCFERLKKPPTNRSDLPDILSAVSEAHLAYLDLYACVTSPKGTYFEFTDELSEKKEALNSKYKYLEKLMDQ